MLKQLWQTGPLKAPKWEVQVSKPVLRRGSGKPGCEQDVDGVMKLKRDHAIFGGQGHITGV